MTLRPATPNEQNIVRSAARVELSYRHPEEFEALLVEEFEKRGLRRPERSPSRAKHHKRPRMARATMEEIAAWV